MKTTLIDGDILVYKAGFAVQETVHRVHLSTTLFIDFNVRKKMNEFIEGYDPGILGVSCYYNAEPPEVAIKTIDRMLKTILKQLKTSKYKIYLTDPDPSLNFRTKVAKTVPYKGHRKKRNRPIRYDVIRDYLIEECGAVSVRGTEADDKLGMEQTDETVVVSVDKDLLMVPGTHYNPVKDRITNVSDPGILRIYKNGAGDKRITGGGFKWFCAQMLLGDPVDNITGIKGMGPVRVYNALKNAKDELSMWSIVEGHYLSNDGDDVRCQENARLLWIWRKPDDDIIKRIKELRDGDQDSKPKE